MLADSRSSTERRPLSDWRSLPAGGKRQTLRGAQRWGARGERIAIIVFALVLPVAGMLLNRTIPFPVDFQAWEVYALVVANTAILLLASFKHATRPRLSFLLLGATFPFSLYFFVVFLPYTPLSILAVIAMGAGFLVLTPTFLFTLHLHLLNKARRSLVPALIPVTVTQSTGLTLGGLACFLLLPAFFIARGLADKSALNSALDHVYTPAIKEEGITFPANRVNLARALRSHRAYKNGIYYPILSDFYAWLVFDNLVLPDDKLGHLEEVFLGAAGGNGNLDPVRNDLSLFGRSGVRGRASMPRAVPPPRTVSVRDLRLDARPSGPEETIVTLTLTLENTEADTSTGAEYVKPLPLPAGVFVTGFRLHINGTPVSGRIVEKKTALWVYTMIRDSERRDPGLLFYNAPDELELRVFPINRNAPVTVEIDFMLPGALTAPEVAAPSDDPAAVLTRLGHGLRPRMTRGERGLVAAGGLDGTMLPAVERETYLHLIIDRSERNDFQGDLAAALRALREKFPAAGRARITLANFDVIDLVPELTPLDQLPRCEESTLQRVLPRAGGLDLDLAVAHALLLHRDADLDRASGQSGPPARPIFVVLGGATATPPPALDLSTNWADLVPALEVHALSTDGTRVTHHAGRPGALPLLRLGGSMRPLLAGRLTRFDAAGESTLLEFWSPRANGWQPVEDATSQPASTLWSRAVSLQLRQQDHARSPGDAGVDPKSLVRSSRESGILLSSTSYIVVENEAQWRMIEQSEDRKLGQNAALEHLETPAPPALFVAISFLLWLGFRRRKRTGACRSTVPEPAG